MDPNQKFRVAIADDHTIFRKGVINIINSFDGFEVIQEAANGRELLDCLQEAGTLPHICVLELNMPVLNGYLTAITIRKRWPAMKILAVSMFNHEESILEMLRCGADGYFVKDGTAAELNQALHRLTWKALPGQSEPSGPTGIISRSRRQDLNITDKQMNMLSLCCTELTYKEMAIRLGISPRTVDNYREALFAKLKVKSRVGLAVSAMRLGLYSGPDPAPF